MEYEDLEQRNALMDDIEEARDERIQPDIWYHRQWLSIAESGVGTLVFFDANPAPKGKYGQIIIYKHDPDTIQFAAENFVDFFRFSNDLI